MRGLLGGKAYQACLLDPPPSFGAPQPLEDEHQLAWRADHVLALDNVGVVQHGQQVALAARQKGASRAAEREGRGRGWRQGAKAAGAAGEGV